MLRAASAKRATIGSACGPRRALGEVDRHLLEAEHRIARIGGQDLARVLDAR